MGQTLCFVTVAVEPFFPTRDVEMGKGTRRVIVRVDMNEDLGPVFSPLCTLSPICMDGRMDGFLGSDGFLVFLPMIERGWGGFVE